jgi:hypothetical protein
MSEDWKAGALAEHEAHNEDLSKDMIEARDLVADLARCWGEERPWPVLCGVVLIYAAGQPLRSRLRLAWRLVRG